MNINLLLGTALLLIGIVLAGFGIATVGLDESRPDRDGREHTGPAG